MREIELLAPAANKEVAKEAILHGADAVYIGAASHGARHKAANSIEDIKETVEFAHRYRVRVYVTVNTLVYDEEIPEVEKLIRQLYNVGVDAIIVQDMSILRMNIPPIQLHASTQCDTRAPGKAQFLQDVGFSQIVLARELSIREIKKICNSVTVPVECFIHGALCVSYSGRCQASEICTKRSANRGECAQMCRLPYTLKNKDNETILSNLYLLSLSDLNASESIGDLIEAGITSFKIEGRLKDSAYVKNVTAAYRRIIDHYIALHPDDYRRSSYGKSEINFIPDLNKSFNRGFTEYFLHGRADQKMASLYTPKSLGEKVTDINDLNNGDGISYINPKTLKYEGFHVNKVMNGEIVSQRQISLPKNVEIRRTYNTSWDKIMKSKSAVRKLWVDIQIDNTSIRASDERGLHIILPLDCTMDKAIKPMNPASIFDRLGDTEYYLRNFENHLDSSIFIPASELGALRRKLISKLDEINIATYKYEYRQPENRKVRYPGKRIDSRDNIANKLAEAFYKSHGVTQLTYALEIKSNRDRIHHNEPIMTTRYCIRRELGCCKKNPVNKEMNSKFKEPLTLSTGNNNFNIEFDCTNCEMNIYSINKY